MLLLFFLEDVIFLFILLLVLRLVFLIFLKTFVNIFRFFFLTLIFRKFLIKNIIEVLKHFVRLNYVSLSNLKKGFGRLAILSPLDKHANTLEICEFVKVVIHPRVDYQRTYILFIHSFNERSDFRFELVG